MASVLAVGVSLTAAPRWTLEAVACDGSCDCQRHGMRVVSPWRPSLPLSVALPVLDPHVTTLRLGGCGNGPVEIHAVAVYTHRLAKGLRPLLHALAQAAAHS